MLLRDDLLYIGVSWGVDVLCVVICIGLHVFVCWCVGVLTYRRLTCSCVGWLGCVDVNVLTWYRKEIKTKNKDRIFKPFVLLMLPYGSKTWSSPSIAHWSIPNQLRTTSASVLKPTETFPSIYKRRDVQMICDMLRISKLRWMLALTAARLKMHSNDDCPQRGHFETSQNRISHCVELTTCGVRPL